LKSAAVFTIRFRFLATIGIRRDVDQTTKCDAARPLPHELFNGFGRPPAPTANTMLQETDFSNDFTKNMTQFPLCFLFFLDPMLPMLQKHTEARNHSWVFGQVWTPPQNSTNNQPLGR